MTSDIIMPSDGLVQCSECGEDIREGVRDALSLLYRTPSMSIDRMAKSLYRLATKYPDWTAAETFETAFSETFCVDAADMVDAVRHVRAEEIADEAAHTPTGAES